MTLDRPVMLLGLASLPILWLLARAAWQRRELAVASLFIWRRLDLAEDAPREKRRRSDRLLFLRMAVALFAVLAAAGPRLGPGTSPPELQVVIDDSLSMSAFEESAARALDAVREAVPDDVELVIRRSPDLTGVTAALACSPGGDVVYITDHRLAGELDRVRVVLVGEPLANVGFTSAWLTQDGEEFTLHFVVRNFSDSVQAASLEVPDPLVCVIQPGESRKVSVPGFGHSLPDEPARLSLEVLNVPGFTFDDSITVKWEEGRRIALRWVGPESPRLALVLRLAGIDITDDAPESICYRSPPVEGTRLLIAPPGDGRRPAGPVTGVGEGIAPESVPGAVVLLGSAVDLERGGRALLSDRSGALAVLRGERVELAIDPGDPASGWALDPSFPIFWSDVAELLGCRSPGSVLVSRLDPEESATRSEGAVPDLAGLTWSRIAGESGSTSLAAVFSLIAAALLVLHMLLEARRV